MAEEIQVSSNPVDSASLTIKRKRGRPRKEDGPGSESGSRRRRKTYSCDVSVGQVVSGVLDGKFDAGYMLTVRVGDTGTLLRGVVFEPSQSIPISAANDIAPHVSMVRRIELPIPSVELKNHAPLKEKDPVAVSVGTPLASVDMASKPDSNSLTATVKVDAKMDPVVNQSPVAQQSVNQNCSMIALKDGVSNFNSGNTIKVSSLNSESRTLQVSEALHPKTMSGVNEKSPLPTSEVASDSKAGSTGLLSSAVNSNSQAVDNNDSKIVEGKIAFSNQSITPVIVHSADARKEEPADLENQTPEKSKAVFPDGSPMIFMETASSVKTEDPAGTQDNVVSSFVPQPRMSNPNDDEHVEYKHQ